MDEEKQKPIPAWIDKIPGKADLWYLIAITITTLFIIYAIIWGSRFDIWLSGFLTGMVSFSLFILFLFKRLFSWLTKKFTWEPKPCQEHTFPTHKMKRWNTTEELNNIQCQKCYMTFNQAREEIRSET